MRNKEKWRKYLLQWQRSNTEKVSGYHKRYKERFPNKPNEQVKEYRKRSRLEVLTHYSNGKLECACCGEKMYEFLCIDHVNGGGTRQHKKTGGNFYAWLRKNKFPLGFRVLCHNCNMSLGFYGYCPHRGGT